MIRMVLICLALVMVGECVDTTSPEKTTIVEGNHFFSNYEISVHYNVDKVNVERPIVLILKKKEENSVFDNNLEITLTSGDSSSQCTFSSFTGMCLLERLPSPVMSMDLKCDHLPCEASWTILQPSVKNFGLDKQSVDDLYKISDSPLHMIAMVSCNNPEIKGFNSLVTGYSE